MASGVPLSALATGVEWLQLPSGLLQAGASRSVYVYVRGTTTQVPVYSNQGLSSALSQPLTTDSGGNVPGFVAAEQQIDFFDALTSRRAQAEPLSVADLVGTDGHVGGAGSLGLPSSVVSVGSPDTGANASARIAVAHEAPLNPLWPEYGVKFDGSTDDTAAWQRLIGALTGVKGAEVYVPPLGTSLITQLAFPAPSVDLTIRGGGSKHNGDQACCLQSSYAGSGAIVQANGAQGFRWEGVSIVATAAAFTGKALDLSRGASGTDTTLFTVKNCSLRAPAQAGSSVHLLQLTDATVGVVEDTYFYGGKYGVDGLTAAGDYCNGITIGDGSYFAQQDAAALHNLGDMCRIDGAAFEPLRNGNAGAYLQDAAIPNPGTLLWLGNWTGDAGSTGAWITYNGLCLIALGDFNSGANAILCNGTIRNLLAGGMINLGSGGAAVNFNGQTVRAFRDLGLWGGPAIYAGTSTGVGAGGGNFGGPTAVQAYMSAAQSIPNGTATTLSWAGTNFDSLGNQWASGNPTRLTAAVPGFYRIDSAVAFAASASGDRTVGFRLNGTTYLQGIRVAPNPTAGEATMLSVSTTAQLNSGDYVECQVLQESGAALNVQPTDGGVGFPTVFGMEKIG